VLSAVYYLRVVRVMTLDEPAEGAAAPLPTAAPAAGYLTLLAAGLFAVGLAWSPWTRAGGEAVASLRPAPPPQGAFRTERSASWGAPAYAAQPDPPAPSP
ncbi:MAG TPA: hypothetical protein VIL46_15310, partial [Gemmataceae bacterium]